MIFGFFIIAMGIEMLMRERAGKKQKESKIILGLIGVLSGLCCGLYGVGALLAAYMDRVTEDSHAFKGNLCFVFWIECTFRLIVYPCIGILNWQSFWHEMLRIFERNGHQEAGHYRADIVRYCTCYPKPLLKYFMPNHFSLYKRCRL